MTNKSKPQKAIHSLKLSVTVADILLSITTPKPGGRRRAYPAHDAAMQIIQLIIAPRILIGKTLHAVTRPMVIELGDHSDKTAKNAILILRNKDVLRLVKPSEAKRNPETGAITRGPHLYELNVKFIQRTVPQTQDDALEAILQNGGTNQDFLDALATCELMGLQRVTGEAIVRAFDEKKKIIDRREAFAAKKGRKVVPADVRHLKSELADLTARREVYDSLSIDELSRLDVTEAFPEEILHYDESRHVVTVCEEGDPIKCDRSSWHGSDGRAIRRDYDQWIRNGEAMILDQIKKARSAR